MMQIAIDKLWMLALKRYLDLAELKGNAEAETFFFKIENILLP